MNRMGGTPIILHQAPNNEHTSLMDTSRALYRKNSKCITVSFFPVDLIHPEYTVINIQFNWIKLEFIKKDNSRFFRTTWCQSDILFFSFFVLLEQIFISWQLDFNTLSTAQGHIKMVEMWLNKLGSFYHAQLTIITLLYLSYWPFLCKSKILFKAFVKTGTASAAYYMHSLVK